MVRRKRLGVLVLTLFVGLPFAVSGAEKTPLARVEVQSTRVDWLPQEAQKSLELRIAGPGDLYIQKDFAAGESPSFNALDRQLPDGVYSYELRAAGGVVQTGSLWVQDGRFVEPEAQEPKPPLRNVTAQTTVLADDLVVQGQACIGANCLSTDVNGAALRIKETNNYQIKFDALNCCVPWEQAWIVQANEPGVNGDFTIRTTGTVPFRIMPTAPDNSFVLFANGNLGLGTLTPATRLDVKASVAGQASERLQNSSATGYSGTEYLDNAGNVDLFFGVDNAASTTRLNSTNNNPIVILTNGAERMRITPSLIYVPSGEVRIPGGSASANGWPTHFNWPLDGKNYIRGTTVIADDGGSVGIGTQAPSSKLHVNGGDIRVSGGSFIDDGVTLNVPDYVFEPDYRLMPLDELRDFVVREKHLPNVPTAETVKKEGLNLSQVQMRLLEKLEELTLYTLKQDEQVKVLQSENAMLLARLEALEQANDTAPAP
jgi:hypothetical protein